MNLTKQMQEDIKKGTKLINQFMDYGYKCYITKGNNVSEVRESEKAVILDLASPDFDKNAARALEIVKQLYIKEQIRAKRKELII